MDWIECVCVCVRVCTCVRACISLTSDDQNGSALLYSYIALVALTLNISGSRTSSSRVEIGVIKSVTCTVVALYCDIAADIYLYTDT